MGRASHKKAGIALEVAVACREALLKHFMPVFRWYENSFSCPKSSHALSSRREGSGNHGTIPSLSLPKGRSLLQWKVLLAECGTSIPTLLSEGGCVTPSALVLALRGGSRAMGEADEEVAGDGSTWEDHSGQHHKA